MALKERVVKASNLPFDPTASLPRLWQGAKPAALPVEQPANFYLAINRKTAKALGLHIPEPLLQRADQVID